MLAEFHSVTKYFNNKLVVDDVNFKIDTSTITVLMGPNGAGKSTIAKMLIGLEKPSSGTIKKKNDLRISYLPQGFKTQKEIPLRFCDYAYLNNLEKDNLVGVVFDSKKKIDHIWDKSLLDMSGGELQTLLLAVSFAKNPDLLILDEPTTYLDFDLETRFYDMIEDQKKENNMSIFIVSHDLHTVTKNADQVLCLNQHLCCKGSQENMKDFIKGSNIGIYQHFHDHKH